MILIKWFGKGVLFVKIDIKYRYKNIFIYLRDYELLGFVIGYDIYYDKILFMGLSCM